MRYRTGQEVTPELVLREQPDAVVLATGAVPLRPAIPGLDAAGVIDAVEVLDGKQAVSGAVLVIGGGMGQGADAGALVLLHEALRPLGLAPGQIRLVLNDTALHGYYGAAAGSRSHYMPTLYATLARYNRWANARLYAEMEKLDPEQLAAQSAVNFGSILAIANHLVLADRLWLNRFTGQGAPMLPPIRSAVHAVGGLGQPVRAFLEVEIDLFKRQGPGLAGRHAGRNPAGGHAFMCLMSVMQKSM